MELSDEREILPLRSHALTMSKHTASICRSGFYHLRQLRSIPRAMTTDATGALVQAFINSKSARNLGFIFDKHLSFSDQITALSTM